MTTAELLQQLREAVKGTTDAPWEWDGSVVLQPLLKNRQYPQGCVRWCQSLTYEHGGQKAPDGNFIAFARNNAAAIIAALEENERMREALERIERGDHVDDGDETMTILHCEVRGDCNCSEVIARAALAQQQSDEIPQ